MIDTVCPSCGSEACSDLVKSYDVRSVANELYSYVQCSQCDLVRLNPGLSPAEIAKAYPEWYHSPWILQQNSFKASNVVYRDNSRRAQFIQHNYGSRGCILDVGCGVGTFIEMMQKQGWKVFGTEYSREAMSIASSLSKADVRLGDLSACLFGCDTFDVITMWHVIEHTNNPLVQLKEAYRILKPGGHLVIATPNISSLSFRVFGRHWYHLDAPRHLVLFSPETLSYIARLADLNVISISAQLYEHNQAAWAMSIGRLVRSIAARRKRVLQARMEISVPASKVMHQTKQLKEIVYWCLGICAYPLVLLEKIIRRPSCFEILLKKPV
jgi:2-polyprenyl-3-methyl-5-hydroxy-6-metoxy-1,4-benzoquinol methylase